MIELRKYVFKEFTVGQSSDDAIIKVLYQFLEAEEKLELVYKNLSGFYDYENNTVLMGSNMFNILNAYKDELFYKYLG